MQLPTADTVDDVVRCLADHEYLADEGLATAVLLAARLERPLFVEGEPGTGKSELARVLSRWTGGELIRLQCHEGIDVAQAAYEWDYTRQLLHVRVGEAAGFGAEQIEDSLFDERFLVRRPLLRAIEPREGPVPVLLIDEIDRADHEFDAFLLELLGDWAVTIPELGTVRAARPPIVIITSNRTRDVHDALKRRCLYHWIEHPDREREAAIIRLRVPEATDAVVQAVADATERLRGLGLFKPPGVAEAIDWAAALAVLGRGVDTPAQMASGLRATLGAAVKYHEDVQTVRDHLDEVVGQS
ncbi:MAG TPA: MoxR family ATPase [Acidimicrobiia bacterium]|nr:MoxR family ATPase [Acidimicrobiia bacterium]